MESTTASMRVGSCHDTTEPPVTPMPCRPAATRSTRSRNWPKVTVSPSAAISIGWAGEAVARRSTSSHMVRAPVSISLVVMTPPSGTPLIAAGGPCEGLAQVGGRWGQNGEVAKRPVHSDPHPVDSGSVGGEGPDRRRQATLVGVAVAVILLAWFAFANLRRVRIDFWVYNRQAPLILVILISGLLGALITALVMRHKTGNRASGS